MFELCPQVPRTPDSLLDLGNIWVRRFRELCSKEWRRAAGRGGMVEKPLPKCFPEIPPLETRPHFALWFVVCSSEGGRRKAMTSRPVSRLPRGWGSQSSRLYPSPPLHPRTLDAPIGPAPELPDAVHRSAALVPPHGAQWGDRGVSDPVQQQPHPARAPVDPAHHGG